MAKRKAFYASAKQKDIKDLQEATKGLSKLFGDAKDKKGLAEKLGVSPSTFRKWETGKSYPSDENFEKLKNTYRGYKRTIETPELKEKFTTKQKKKKTTARKKKNKTLMQFMNADKFLDKYYHNRYKEAIKYEYFRLLIQEKDLKFAGYYLDNPKEAVFLTTKKQPIIKETFMHMIGVTHNYPYNDASNQMFIRRLPRVASGIRDLNRNIFDNAREIFYSGENADKIENFIGFYFDSLE